MLSLATAIVRAWTRCYTCRLPPALRDARRAEIESDLWEFEADARQHGGRSTLSAAHMLARVLLGVPDDVLWRAEHGAAGGRIGRSLWVTLAVAVVALVAIALWALPVLAPAELPTPAPMAFIAAPPPPPPPVPSPPQRPPRGFTYVPCRSASDPQRLMLCTERVKK
jgi:hypothetical protein